ncbi:MAG: hypothetical protein KF795_00555 [Labilithrix sp.]|nr:hypothetical protein [Labilithrix sp.]
MIGLDRILALAAEHDARLAEADRYGKWMTRDQIAASIGERAMNRVVDRLLARPVARGGRGLEFDVRPILQGLGRGEWIRVASLTPAQRAILAERGIEPFDVPWPTRFAPYVGALDVAEGEPGKLDHAE